MKEETIVAEFTNLSTENEKHYLLNNGMHRIIAYAQPTKNKILMPNSKKAGAATEAQKAKSKDFLEKLLLDYEEKLKKSDMPAEAKALNLSIAKMSLQKSNSDTATQEVVNDSSLINMWGFTDDGEEFTGQDSYVVDNFYRNYPMYYVGLSINLATYSKIGMIKNLTLSLYSTDGDGCSIYELNSDNSLGAAIADVPSGNRVDVNFNKAVAAARFGEAKFAIASSDEYGYDVRYFASNTCSDTSKRPYLIIDYIPLDEVLIGQKYLECQAGNSINCNVDILTGIPYFSVPLLNLGGEKLPLSLRFCYDSVEPNTPALGLKTYLGNGWYTNYHQSCYKGKLDNKDCYYYTDANRIKHVFLLAINSSSLWVDSQGTGLLLEVVNSNVKIYDETGNSFIFDSKGRLTQINVKQTDNMTFSNTVTYRDTVSTAISTITDGMGRVVQFSYNNNGGAVSLSGTTKIQFTLSGSQLKTITLLNATGNNSGTLNNATIEFTTSSEGKIYSAKSAMGETISLDYYGKNCVKSIYNPVTKLTQNFVYDSFTTTVTSDKNVVWIYDFDRRGEFISSYEKNGAGNKDLRFVSQEACQRYSGTLSERKDINFFKGNVIKLTKSATQPTYRSEPFTTSVAGLYNYAVFSIALEATNGYMNSGAGYIGALVELVDENKNTLCSIEFEPYSSAMQVGAKLFKLKGTNANNKQLRVKINVMGNGNYAFSNAFITPLNAPLNILCGNKNTGDLCPYNFDSEALYYLGENTSIKDNGKTFNYVLHAADYIANERNFYTAEYDESGNIKPWNMWVDKKRKMITGVKTPYIDFGNSYGFSFDSEPLYFTTLAIEEHTMNAERQTHNSAKQILINNKNTYMRRILKSYTRESNSATEHFTQNVYYNKFNRLLRQTDSKQIVDYNYSDEGYLLSTKAQDATSSGLNIYSSQTYSSGYLTESKDYLLSTIATTKFTYDSMGKVIDITAPNDFDMLYSYYSYGETLKQVKGVDGSSVLSDSQINYTDNKISELYHNSFGYTFSYNKEFDINKINISGNLYANINYVYNNYSNGAYRNGSITTISYNNGDSVENYCDKYGRLIKKSSGSDSAYFIYADNQTTGHNASGSSLNSLTSSSYSKLYKTIDEFINTTTLYYYNDYGNVTKISEDAYISYDAFTIDFRYDDRQRITKETYSLDGTFMTVDLTYETGDNAKQYDVKTAKTSINGQTVTAEAERDNLERIKKKTVKTVTSGKEIIYSSDYIYATRNDDSGEVVGTTNYVSQEKHTCPVNGASTQYRTDTYTYDINRNIASVKHKEENIASSVNYNGDTVSYKYDAANRLIRENNPFLGTTSEYTYNNGGNITSKKVYSYTTGTPTQLISSYDYKYTTEFKDRLMQLDYRSNNKLTSYQFLYDYCGNPIIYKGNELVWTRGKLLQQYPLSDGSFAYFSYDANGLRRRKFYFWNDYFDSYVDYGFVNGKLIYERRCESIRFDSYEYIYYIYDQNEIIGANIGGVTYYFVKNMQGDVIQLRNASTGALVAKYEYDAWGNHKVLNPNGSENTDEYFVGNLNPFRYRSYFYDTDLKMYYLQTRWYDPEIGRFINLAQIEKLNPETINGLNLYAYSFDNPVNRVTFSTGISLFAQAFSALSNINRNKPTTSLNPVNNVTNSNNALNIHWVNKWFDTDWPKFFVLSKEGFEVVNWELSTYKESLYFDEQENYSIYVSGGNVHTYAGLSYKDGIGISATAGVASIGYDGRIIDASVDFLTIGFTYMWKDGKLGFGLKTGLIGFSFSIDFVELWNLISGNF